jgi:hypothetical protein
LRLFEVGVEPGALAQLDGRQRAAGRALVPKSCTIRSA